MPNSYFNISCKRLVIFILVISLSLSSSSNLEEQLQNGDTTTLAESDAKSTKLKELRASEALVSIRNWALRFGREIYHGTQEASCFRLLHDQFDPTRADSSRRGPYKATVISNDWTTMHADIVRTISNTMSWHKSAVEAIARASEGLAKNHTFEENLRFDYVDVHRLHDLNDLTNAMSGENAESDQEDTPNEYPPTNHDQHDGTPVAPHTETAQLDLNGQLLVTETQQNTQQTPEPLPIPAALQADRNYSDLGLGSGQDVEWQTPLRYMKLQRHENFGDVLISTEDSAVHVPVHIFSGDPNVMNGIAWSDGLTKVFRDNFVRNPKLTNQYFASQLGFLRLFPAQRWQIPRNDPDLYDARMRPWYVAGASSRKEVVILVDSSGSMTGSRRDIAKGVVFEILDTLTDNDNFLILKFSDSVQQLGVPACEKMRLKRRRGANIPLKNQLFHPDDDGLYSDSSLRSAQAPSSPDVSNEPRNGTDVESLYFLPATGRNVRYVKTNFTIPTSGIANFSHALVTAFEVLLKYQDTKQLGSQCNQAIMLITDGSPSDFEDIFNRYNYPNAPVRVFTYLIGREAGDGSHTKMMACRNRGYYTHVINLAEVRETVQQYVPVMARPLVLNRAHPITWTPAYGELTYQMLTDWIWESRRREKARAILAAKGRGSLSNQQPNSGAGGYVPDISVSSSEDVMQGNSLLDQNGSPVDASETGINGLILPESLDQELDALDIFGYIENPECFWETTENDLLTTVVQPVHDLKNDTKVVERFLNKNTWVTKEMIVRTANLLGVAAADMKINDIIALAPSHKLGPNGYAIMLSNNGLVMHHPDLRSILEPGLHQQATSSGEPQPSTFRLNKLDKSSRILKPFFSSLDFTQLEHILNDAADGDLLTMRREAVEGLTGWHELMTKRTIDCQRRVQSRKQSFYYKSVDQFPFSFMIAIPQPYGSHRLEAQVDIKSAPSTLPEKLTTYFTTSDFDIWTVHPSYEYCSGPSNNTITTLLDMFMRIQDQKLDDIQARPAESTKPPISLPGKIVYNKELVQSMVYDAVATYGFSESCSLPSPTGEQNFLNMFGVRFSFVATRSGLTRVRHFIDDSSIKKEALAFARRHPRASDETFYKRTVDYNMLINETATLIQVPFNMHQKIFARLDRHEMEQLNGQADELDSSTSSAGTDSATSPIDLSPESSSTRLRVSDMDLFEKLDILANSSLHAIATQSILVKEGNQRAVAGVVGVFYDYAQFVQRLLNITNSNFKQQSPGDSNLSKVRCGYSNDTIDCLLVDNNGYILVSEELEFIGRHLRAFDPVILSKLVSAGVYHEVNVTDYQSICLDPAEKQSGNAGGHSSSGSSGALLNRIWLIHAVPLNLLQNLTAILVYCWTLFLAVSSLFMDLTLALIVQQPISGRNTLGAPMMAQQPSMLSLIPKKTYLRPCERILTRHETRPGVFSSDAPEYYTTTCNCPAWFVYEQVAQTNLILIIVDTKPSCRNKCESAQERQQQELAGDKFNIIGHSEKKVCSMVEREFKLHKRTLDSCYAHHPDEEHIRLCGSANRITPVSIYFTLVLLVISVGFSCPRLRAQSI